MFVGGLNEKWAKQVRQAMLYCNMLINHNMIKISFNVSETR